MSGGALEKQRLTLDPQLQHLNSYSTVWLRCCCCTRKRTCTCSRRRRLPYPREPITCLLCLCRGLWVFTLARVAFDLVSFGIRFELLLERSVPFWLSGAQVGCFCRVGLNVEQPIAQWTAAACASTSFIGGTTASVLKGAGVDQLAGFIFSVHRSCG